VWLGFVTVSTNVFLNIAIGHVNFLKSTALFVSANVKELLRTMTPDGGCSYETAKWQSGTYASVGIAASYLANM